MTRKRYVKQLMALGIQRNDAAGFVKAARIIQDKGMGHLVPDLVFDMPVPINVQQREIKKMAATFTGSIEFELSNLPAEEKKEYIKGRLCHALANGLIDSGLCKITATTDERAHAITYRAAIEVAVPREVPA